MVSSVRASFMPTDGRRRRFVGRGFASGGKHRENQPTVLLKPLKLLRKEFNVTIAYDGIASITFAGSKAALSTGENQTAVTIRLRADEVSGLALLAFDGTLSPPADSHFVQVSVLDGPQLEGPIVDHFEHGSGGWLRFTLETDA